MSENGDQLAGSVIPPEPLGGHGRIKRRVVVDIYEDDFCYTSTLPAGQGLETTEWVLLRALAFIQRTLTSAAVVQNLPRVAPARMPPPGPPGRSRSI